MPNAGLDPYRNSVLSHRRTLVAFLFLAVSKDCTRIHAGLSAEPVLGVDRILRPTPRTSRCYAPTSVENPYGQGPERNSLSIQPSKRREP